MKFNSRRISPKSRAVRITLALIFAAVSPAWSQTATNLAFFGTNSTPFQIDGGFTSASYSQGSSTLTLNVPFSGGQTLFGAFGLPGSPVSFDWSGETELALSLSATVPPAVLLNLDFTASDLVTVLASAEVGVGGIGSTPTTVVMNFTSGDISALNDVAAIYFIWGGDSLTGDTAVTIHSIQAVPEPTTWAMIVAAAAVFALLGWRRSYRAGKI